MLFKDNKENTLICFTDINIFTIYNSLFSSEIKVLTIDSLNGKESIYIYYYVL